MLKLGAFLLIYCDVLMMVFPATGEPARPDLKPPLGARFPEDTRLRDGHSFNCVLCAAFDPSSQMLLTADPWDIKLWSIAQRRVVANIPLTREATDVQLAWGPNGILVGVNGCSIELWKYVSDLEVVTVLPVQANVESMILSANGRYLAVFGNRFPIIWDLEGNRRVSLRAGPQWRWPVSKTPVAYVSCAFSRDNQQVTLLEAGGYVSVWDITSGRRIWRSRASEDAQAIYSLDDHTYVELTRSQLRLVDTIKGHSVSRDLDGACRAAFLHDDVLWVAAEKGTLTSFPLATLIPREGLQVEGYVIDGLVVSPDGNLTAIFGDCGPPLILHRKRPLKESIVLPRWADCWQGLSIHALRFYVWSPMGLETCRVLQEDFERQWVPDRGCQLMVMDSCDIVLETNAEGLISVKNLREENTLFGPTPRALELALAPDDRAWLALFYPQDDGVELVNLEDARTSLWTASIGGTLADALTEPSGRWLIWGVAEGKKLRMRGLQVPELRDLTLPECFPWGMALSSSGVLANGTPHGVQLHDLEAGQPLRCLPVAGWQLAFSRCGSLLAVGEADMLNVFRVHNGEIIFKQPCLGKPTNLRFGPRNLTVLGLVNGLLTVWTVDPPTCLCTLARSLDRQGWVIYTPDGRYDGTPGVERHLSTPGTNALRRVPGLLRDLLLSPLS